MLTIFARMNSQILAKFLTLIVFVNVFGCLFTWQEIEKAWKMVDASHEKEQRARETIQSLKLEIANLSKLVEQGAGLTMGQEHRWIYAMKRSIEGIISGGEWPPTIFFFLNTDICGEPHIEPLIFGILCQSPHLLKFVFVTVEHWVSLLIIAYLLFVFECDKIMSIWCIRMLKTHWDECIRQVSKSVASALIFLFQTRSKCVFVTWFIMWQETKQTEIL